MAQDRSTGILSLTVSVGPHMPACCLYIDPCKHLTANNNGGRHAEKQIDRERVAPGRRAKARNAGALA